MILREEKVNNWFERKVSGKTNSSTISNGTNFSHEALAQDEQSIGVFFAAFSVQVLFQVKLLQFKLKEPKFLDLFNDIVLFASQRIFINKLLHDEKYKLITQYIRDLIRRNSIDPKITKQPYILFLSELNNKSFLIRQIFGHSSQVLPKYTFINKYLEIDITKVNIDMLFREMENLSIEEQVLCLSRIFIKLQDQYVDKQKTIKQSFEENLKRTKEELINNQESRKNVNMKNIDMLEEFYKNWN